MYPRRGPDLAVTVRGENGERYEVDAESTEPSEPEQDRPEVEGVFAIRNGRPEPVDGA